MFSISKPPTKPIIETTNPIASGLVFDALFFEGSGLSTNELVNNINGTLSGGPPTWKTMPSAGYDLDFTASTDIDTFTTPASVNSLTTQSYECYVNLRSVATASRRVFHKGNINSDTYFQFGQDDNSATQYQVHSAHVSTTGSWVFTHAGLNTWEHIVITYDNTALVNNPICYINGKSVTVTTQASPVGAIVSDDTYLAIGNRADTLRNWDGGILYARIWNRILTANEALLLYQNPFRIYQLTNLGNEYRYGSVGDGMSRSESWT